LSRVSLNRRHVVVERFFGVSDFPQKMCSTSRHSLKWAILGFFGYLFTFILYIKNCIEHHLYKACAATGPRVWVGPLWRGYSCDHLTTAIISRVSFCIVLLQRQREVHFLFLFLVWIILLDKWIFPLFFSLVQIIEQLEQSDKKITLDCNAAFKGPVCKNNESIQGLHFTAQITLNCLFVSRLWLTLKNESFPNSLLCRTAFVLISLIFESVRILREKGTKWHVSVDNLKYIYIS